MFEGRYVCFNTLHFDTIITPLHWKPTCLYTSIYVYTRILTFNLFRFIYIEKCVCVCVYKYVFCFTYKCSIKLLLQYCFCFCFFLFFFVFVHIHTAFVYNLLNSLSLLLVVQFIATCLTLYNKYCMILIHNLWILCLIMFPNNVYVNTYINNVNKVNCLHT